MGLSVSDLCTFCLDASETISHLFWECPYTQRFLGEFQREVLKDEVALTFNNFIFGFLDGPFTILNFVVLYAKYYIFTTRYKNGKLCLALFQKALKHYYEIDEIIYLKQGKIILFLDKWRHVQLI